MKKRRSLVKNRWYSISACLFYVCLFRAQLVHIYAQRYVNEQEQQFILQGERFKESMNSLYYTGVVDTSRVNFELQIIERYMGASVFFMNKDGKISMVLDLLFFYSVFLRYLKFTGIKSNKSKLIVCIFYGICLYF